MSEFENSIRVLISSPIFAMSLGNKELFHSNFWVWLMANERSFAHFFFEKIDSDDYDLKREEDHRDITITYKGKKYVIENKLKSVAKKEQLEEYQKKLASNFGGGVLTGIEEKDLFKSFELPEDWNYISYKDISKKIKEIAERIDDIHSTDKTVYKTILLEYVKMLDALIAVFQEYRSENERVLPNKESKYDKEMHELRIYDLCKKYSADSFVKELISNEVFNELVYKFKVLDYKLIPSSGFWTGNSMVEVKAKTTYDAKKPFSEIIIQIQGDQYRWCALKHINRKATEEDKSELFDYFKSKDWFVEYIKGDKVIKHNKKEYKTSLRNSFCAYSAPSDDPNDMYYCMVYQYYTLQGTNDYRFDDLIQKILTDLDKAYCICLETNAISQ